MGKEDELPQNVKIYEFNNKKYTVITRCMENAQSKDKLYNVICKYIVSQINSN